MAMPIPTNLSGSKFKGERGQLLTKSLFYETSLKADLALYTLKDFNHTVDGKEYPSLYLLYMGMEDPTEYGFATAHLDSWSHWEALCNCSWFKDTAARWRKELELKMMSQNVQRIRKLAESDGRGSLDAQKYLLEKKWLSPAERPKRGRPSKEEAKAYLVEEANEHFQLTQTLQRLNS